MRLAGDAAFRENEGKEIDNLPSSESEEPLEEASLRLKERTRRSFPAEPPTLFALSIPDIVTGDGVIELMVVKSKVEMLSTKEWMIVALGKGEECCEYLWSGDVRWGTCYSGEPGLPAL